jgi:2-oxoglutarate dehydrogenase complex dehydrogenase (E1) component-like enzyme
VLTNVIQKHIKAILNEFSEVESEDSPTARDVKYHIGANYTWLTPSEKKVSLSVVANPVLQYCILFQFCSIVLDQFITPSIF